MVAYWVATIFPELYYQPLEFINMATCKLARTRIHTHVHARDYKIYFNKLYC